MIRTFKYIAALVLLSLFIAPGLNAAELSSEYLSGRWAINAENCDSPDAEYLEFNKDGTFTGTRGAKTEIVGFWNIKDDIINLHMVTSPAFFTDIHSDLSKFEDIYNYFKIKMVIFNVQDKNFETFAIIGDIIERSSATRCK